MLNPDHIRESESASRAGTSLRLIKLVVENSRSFALSTSEEISATAYQQREDLIKHIAANDPIRKGAADEIGCGATINFRRSKEDFNITEFICGDDITVPNVPQFCCICEALITINKRRLVLADRLVEKNIPKTCYEEENFLTKYRDRGLIKTRYIGQYVEIERQRLLRIQEQQFFAFRISACPRVPDSSATLERIIRRDGTEESDNISVDDGWA
jgi:hypothetical protein